MSSVIFLFSFPSTTIMALCFAPPKLSPFQAALQKPTGVPEHHPSSSLRREVFFHAGCAPPSALTSSLPFCFKQNVLFSLQHSMNTRLRWRLNKDLYRGCQCSGSSVTELGSMVVAVDWRPAVEHLMLMSSVVLAYVAGIAAPAKPSTAKIHFHLPFQGHPSQKKQATVQGTIGQKSHKQSSQPAIHGNDVWNSTQAKLIAALTKLDQVEREMVEVNEDKEGPPKRPMLSLQALSNGPRLRLLLQSLEHLRKEVNGISESSGLLASAEWSELSMNILCNLIEPICREWLAMEPSLVNPELMKVRLESSNNSGSANVEVEDITELQTRGGSSRKGEDLVLSYLQRTGKTQLYMDLLFFLRFKTMRPGCCCDHRIMLKHAGNALEDMVVAIADSVAAMYLGQSSLMGGQEENDWPILVRSSILSTRVLERFRNQVALNGWLQKNFSSVVAMFEDRFELWTIQGTMISNQHPVKGNKTKRQGGQLKQKEHPEELRFSWVQMPARRSRELKGLTGWRYYYSLYLEFSDIVGPLLQVLVLRLEASGMAVCLGFFAELMDGQVERNHLSSLTKFCLIHFGSTSQQNGTSDWDVGLW